MALFQNQKIFGPNWSQISKFCSYVEVIFFFNFWLIPVLMICLNNVELLLINHLISSHEKRSSFKI